MDNIIAIIIFITIIPLLMLVFYFIDSILDRTQKQSNQHNFDDNGWRLISNEINEPLIYNPSYININDFSGKPGERTSVTTTTQRELSDLMLSISHSYPTETATQITNCNYCGSKVTNNTQCMKCGAPTE